MEDDQKLAMREWKEVLKGFLDPVKIMDALPTYFPINSHARNHVSAKHATPHEAIGVLMDELVSVPESFDGFLEAIGRDHEWLVSLIKGKIDEDEIELGMNKINYLNYVNQFLTIMVTNLNENIDAKEISYRLRAKQFMSQEDDEMVQARVGNDGNTAGVRLLLSILARKPLGWQKEFKQIIRYLNYNAELLEMLENLPDDPTSFHKMSHRSTRDSLFTEEQIVYNSSNKEACEENLVFEENGDFDNNAVKYDKLHSTIPPTPSRANTIIPKEARYNTPLSRSKQPVRGENSLRPQERVLSAKPISGENIIICGPESPDRTRMIVHIIQSRFPMILDSAGRKILFLVSKIRKQHDVIRLCFASEQWSVNYYDENATCTLNHIMQSSQVIMSTPNALLKWLLEEGDENRITEFDMLIIDDCETASEDGPCREILLEYLKANKMSGSYNLPQVIGLTSNLVYGKIANPADAVENIKCLCSLFDAKGGISVATPNLSKKPIRRLKTRPKQQNCITDMFTLCLCETINEIVVLFYKLDVRKVQNLTRPNKIPQGKGSREYIQWCRNLSDKADLIDNALLRNDIKKCAMTLEIFNRALLIKNKCSSEDSMRVLENELKNYGTGGKIQKGGSPVAENKLYEMCKKAVDNLRSYVQDPVEENTSQKEIEKALTEKYSKNKNIRSLIVVQHEEIMEPLETWLNRSQNFKRFGFNAKCHKSAESGAISTRYFRKLLADFKSGSTKVLIVNEPDIKQIKVSSDLIICYDCTTPANLPLTVKTVKSFIIQISSNSVVANDKVKISKQLLVDQAVMSIQNMWENDRSSYLEELEAKQNAMMRPILNPQPRGTRNNARRTLSQNW